MTAKWAMWQPNSSVISPPRWQSTAGMSTPRHSRNHSSSRQLSRLEVVRGSLPRTTQEAERREVHVWIAPAS